MERPICTSLFYNPCARVTYRVFLKIDSQSHAREASEVFRQFDELNPPVSTVGTKEGNVVLPEVRSGRSLQGITMSLFTQTPEFPTAYPDVGNGDVIVEALPKRFIKRFINSEIDVTRVTDEQGYPGEARLWSLHCYDKGDFFDVHTDGKKSPRHFATILVFPPASGDDALVSFQGGELSIRTGSGASITYFPSTFTQWTMIVFPIKFEHKCSPVTEGRRFVLKTDLELPPETPYYTNTVPQTERAPVDMKDCVQEIDEEIAFLKEKIAVLTRRRKDALAGNITDRVHSIMGALNDGDLIVLPTDEITTQPSSLTGENGLLWNEVIKSFPYSTLTTVQCVYRGDGVKVRPDEIEFADFSPPGEVHYLRPLSEDVPGRWVESRQEYNDETYDEVQDRTVVVICVQEEAADLIVA